MFATVTNLNNMNLGDTIVVADDRTDSYTKIRGGIYKGMFESHLYSGDLYSVKDLAEQLEGVECEILSDCPVNEEVVKMMNIITVDETSTGWKDEYSNYPTTIQLPGLLRGFNVEVTNARGEIDYCSAVWTYGEANEENFDIFISIDLASYNGWVPTGRLVFRGYAIDRYDPEEREEYVEVVSPEYVQRYMDKDWR